MDSAGQGSAIRHDTCCETSDYAGIQGKARFCTVTGRRLTFQMSGDACYSVVVEYECLQAVKLWEPFQDDDIVIREVYAVKLVLQKTNSRCERYNRANTWGCIHCQQTFTVRDLCLRRSAPALPPDFL